ncbi:trehalase isoform X2 [Rana temporaria]|uniref:trehalase isoform X2 n=1 Tax=Rana temporaria TaxID=8407 RepID=UPI001AADBB4F|nr:trehalase isoform X2 [Rana temporaria]
MNSSAWWVTLLTLFCVLQKKGVNGNFTTPCDSQIFCTGKFLHHVQMAKIFEDDKHFVDMSLRDSPNKIHKKFQSLLLTPPSGLVDREKLITFLNTSFNHPGTELEQWDPPDWNESPKFLSGIVDAEFRKWAQNLTSLWKSLGRKIKEEVKTQPDRYSLIYVPNPLIVPGGRFREFYYWDSYWVINGLILSEMTQTARGMIENFLYMVQRYGMIPNGGRIYYIRRSQPPFLTLMMESYMESQKNLTFLRESIPTLLKEYDFWMNNRSISVSLNGNNYTLNRYYVPVGEPRPESYSKDFELAENLTTTEAKQLLYSDITAAAESGWDFSTRWFYGSTDTLLDTKTSSVVPVDLNAILCRVERTLVKFYTDLGEPEMVSRFSEALKQRLKAVQDVLWDPDLGVWLDYNTEHQKRNTNFYPSNLSPLWASCYEDTTIVDKLVSYLEKSEALTYKNGLPTSMKNSGQQWDFPNGWAPLQHMVIEGLEKTQSPKAQEMAFKLAQKWVTSNFRVFKEYNAMFEKYDVEGDGKPGGGGEYEVQLGFGWSNGVILQLLDLYRSRLTSSAIMTSLSFSTLLLIIIPIIMLTLWV